MTSPYFAYHHSNQVVPNEGCPTGSSSIAGLEFEFAVHQHLPGRVRRRALLRRLLSRLHLGHAQRSDGLPAPGQIRTFVAGAANPVNLEIGPGGDLYYADFDGGTIRRIRYTSSANQPPTAVASATPTSGSRPLTVNFNGSGSSDPNGDTLTYAWDLDGDGAFDDSTASQPTYTYTQPGSYTAALRVTDPGGCPTPTRS